VAIAEILRPHYLALLIWLVLPCLQLQAATSAPGKKMSENWGLHWVPWLGVMAYQQFDNFYGFVALGSDASLAPWLVFSAFGGSSSNAQATDASASQIMQRWNLNGVGYGVMAGYGPSLSLDDNHDIMLDFLAVGGVSYFYKGASLYSFGTAVGMRFRFSESVVFAFRIPLIGLAYGQRFTTESPGAMVGVSGVDNLVQFYSNTFVSMPFISIGYSF
jgi:hypothetical protein